MTAPVLTPGSLVRLFDIPFTDEQLAAITAPHAPAVVIAGAGSGKTALMAARVVWLVATAGVTPDAVLGLTFTNKAAGELSTRVRRALRLLADDGHALADGEPTVSTYHAYAAALLREYGVFAGHEPAALVLTDAQRVQLAESVVRRAPGPFPALRGKVTSLTEKVVALDAELNEHLVDADTLAAFDRATIAAIDEVEHLEGKVTADPAKARETARARLELLPLVADFRREKRRRERVDFGDQMAAAALLAEQVACVAESERARFATVLLDEYQDTSMAQQRLLVALFGAGHPVMAVGDPFQSIYGWRGASVRNILSFRHDFADPDPTPVFSLAQNNRSGERILDVANAVAEPLRADFPDVVPLRPREAHRGRGEVVAGLYLTCHDEVQAVCDDIAAQVREGRPPGDLAILCRESKAFGDYIEALGQRHIPVEVVGLAGLLDLPEVIDVVSVLEVLHDPGANPSLLRLLTGPRWRIGAHDLALLGARAAELASPRASADVVRERPDLEGLLRDAVQGIDPVEAVSLLEALEDPGARPYSGQARERFAALAAELRSLRPGTHDAPDLVLARVIAVTGIDVELATSGAGTRNLEALLEQARTFSASGGGSGLGPFLAYLGVARRYGAAFDVPAPVGTGGVALLTVHKAKGLEWPVVYVPQVSEGVFPNRRTRSTPLTSPAVLPYPLRGDAADFPDVRTWQGNQGIAAFKQEVSDRERAEDRRLAYVALTRAADRLVVTGHWWGPTQSEPRGLSPYLEVVADFCRTGGGVLSRWEPAPDDAATSPVLAVDRSADWPASGDPAAAAARREAAELVRAAIAGAVADPGDELDPFARTRVEGWDADLEVLLAEADRPAASSTVVPAVVSASRVVDLLRDPEVVRRWRRPLPRRPAAAAARGTRFHEWVEARFGQVPLLDLDGLVPVQADGASDVDTDAELQALQRAFAAGPYADRAPLAVEAPFQMVLDDQLVVGRIDAVYRVDDPHLPTGVQYEVVDWKTGRHEADPLQLALYRLAWAELQGVPLEAVAATFYYVATGEVVHPTDLPDREALAVWWRQSKAYAPSS